MDTSDTSEVVNILQLVIVKIENIDICYICEPFGIMDVIMREVKCMNSSDVHEAVNISQFVVAEIKYFNVCDGYESMYIF